MRARGRADPRRGTQRPAAAARYGPSRPAQEDNADRAGFLKTSVIGLTGAALGPLDALERITPACWHSTLVTARLPAATSHWPGWLAIDLPPQVTSAASSRQPSPPSGWPQGPPRTTAEGSSRAAARVLQGEPEQACAGLLRALHLALDAGYAMGIERVRGMRARFAAAWAALPCVRELDEQLRLTG